MIPSHLSLIPFCPERRAALEAIAEVERRRLRGAVSTVFPYASAFFRRLTGRKRVTLKEIRLFAPVLSAQELRGSRDNWLRAIDALIESRGVRLKSTWPSTRRRRSAPGALAGRELTCASSILKICSGAGASVSRPCPHWSRMSITVNRSGAWCTRPAAPAPVRQMERWMVPNKLIARSQV